MLLVSLLTYEPATAADVSAKDIQIATRTIAFMEEAPKGKVTVAIIYNPADAGSVAEAESIKTLIGKYPKAGDATLQPELLPVDNLAALADGQVAFVTQGLAGGDASVFQATSAKKILTIAIGDTCVREGHCVVGVLSSPKVQILVNKSASSQSLINFKSAFLMMVKEV